MKVLFSVTVFLVFFKSACVNGHGRLIEPPARSSMWRRTDVSIVNQYRSCINENPGDDGLRCGGRFVQFVENEGRCGVCGDSFSADVKENESGGRFAKGIVTREYLVGAVIDVEVDITIPHGGYFEFRLCPWNNTQKAVTQECLNRHKLLFADNTDKWNLPANNARNIHQLQLRLPEGVACTQCVLQWKHKTASEEEYINCADIAIGTSLREPTLCEQGKTTTTTTTTVKTTTVAAKKQKKTSCSRDSSPTRRCYSCRQTFRCIRGKRVYRNCPTGKVCDRVSNRCVLENRVPRCAGKAL